MNLITVGKTNLIKILKDNRKKHVAVFKEAYEEYRKEYIGYLEKCLSLAKAEGRVIIPDDEPEEPRSYVKSYGIIIGMLEMSMDDRIQLSEQDYRRYVKDEWEWSRDFYTSNSSYSSSSSSSGSISCSASCCDDIDAIFSLDIGE